MVLCRIEQNSALSSMLHKQRLRKLMRFDTTYPESMFSLIFSALEGCHKAGSIDKITEVM